MAAIGASAGAAAIAPIPATTERRLGENCIACLPFSAPPDARQLFFCALTLFPIGPKMKPHEALPPCDDAPMMSPVTRTQGRSMRIGFIGTGTMGTPIAGCLVAAGHQLTVCDIRREATQRLHQQGAAVADTPRAVAQTSEVVFTSLPGPGEVETAALDPTTGLLAGLPGG